MSTSVLGTIFTARWTNNGKRRSAKQRKLLNARVASIVAVDEPAHPIGHARPLGTVTQHHAHAVLAHRRSERA
jgi:hypothetical protein